MGALVGGGFYNVSSSSMLPTLYPGETFLALPHFGDGPPAAGTILLFRKPDEPRIEWVKRIVAGPGQAIEMRDGRPVIDGQPVDWSAAPDMTLSGDSARENCSKGGVGDADLCVARRWTETLRNGISYDVIDLGESSGDNIAPLKVPEGHIFVIGDNRDNSIDSRFPAVGFVPIESITGVAWRRVQARDADGVDLRRFLEVID